MSITVAARPRIADDVFIAVLERHQSPAAPAAASCYAACVARGVDPAVALAFFKHESSYGKAGKAVTTRNWGNLRSGRRAYKVAQVGNAGGPFAWYHSWVESIADFCDLLLGPIYAGKGRHTVAQIIPVYAPSSDNNRPAHYIADVERAVALWAKADPFSTWGSAFALDPAARGFAIPRRWLSARPPLGPAIGPEQALSPGRAAQAFRGGVVVWLGGEQTAIVRADSGNHGSVE